MINFNQYSLSHPNCLKKKNYNGIDIVKFIMSLIVLIAHIRILAIDKIPYIDFFINNFLLRIVVPFFFICSGYFLFRNMDLNKPNFKKIKKYILRICKMYLIWSLIYLPLNIYNYIQAGNSFFESILIYIRNFFFVGSYSHLWYLLGTIIAFSIIAFCLYIKLKPKTILIISGILYLIGLIYQLFYKVLIETPVIKNIIEMYDKVFESTRNGIFFGFFFVAIGMYFTVSKIKLTKNKTILGFVICYALLFCEALITENLAIARSCDMYVFSVPAVSYLFYLATHIELKNRKTYKNMRSSSTLIYLSHFWFVSVYSIILQIIYSLTGNQVISKVMNNSHIQLIFTLVFTLVVSQTIIYLSNKKYKRLKILY